jgi:hypothetical protein
MTGCALLSERMAVVAHRRGTWSPDEEAHLAACGDCLSEWRLIQAGARLGHDLDQSFPADMMATRVMASLRQPAPRLLRPRVWRWLAVPAAAAAAIALVMWRGPSSPPAGDRTSRPMVSAEANGLLPELEELGTTELESVLQLLPAVEDGVDDIHNYNDMTEDEVETILRSLEG